ncbi:MAG: hypothetical protein KKE76_04010 [Gammaproteobacteria bacterium]|nr:hypothetical protein [Gammaproteobacteria bacterium]
MMQLMCIGAAAGTAKAPRKLFETAKAQRRKEKIDMNRRGAKAQREIINKTSEHCYIDFFAPLRLCGSNISLLPALAVRSISICN